MKQLTSFEILFNNINKKSSGKTIITIGLSALLNEMNYKLSVFKKGPDYIDPLWISQAAGCRML